LRSIDYAGHAALKREHRGDWGLLAPWLKVWTHVVCTELLSSYRETAGPALFLPSDEKGFRQLLDLYLVDRAVREIIHDLVRSRETLGVPVAALCEMIHGER
jgi:predicted trehalose synthase